MMTADDFDSPVHVPKLRCKKDILVRGDIDEDVSDIVEKFIKVAHGPEALENNRARENARENIRKKLAMEAGREKSDGCDLQVRDSFRNKKLWNFSFWILTQPP